MFDRKAWREAHKEEARAYHKRYRDLKREELRTYRQVNRVKIGVNRHIYTEQNVFKLREYNRITSIDKRMKVKHAIFEILGSQCIKCGFSNIHALEIDHVFGGGYQHRKRTPGSRYYPSILNDPEIRTKFQILCANCNRLKRYECNEFSHKKKVDNQISA